MGKKKLSSSAFKSKFFLTNSPKLFCTVNFRERRSLFEEVMTPGLVLSVEICSHVYWKGRLIVVSGIFF